MSDSNHEKWIDIISVSSPIYKGQDDSFDFTDDLSDDGQTGYILEPIIIPSYQTGSVGGYYPSPEKLSLAYEPDSSSHVETSGSDWDFAG